MTRTEQQARMLAFACTIATVTGAGCADSRTSSADSRENDAAADAPAATAPALGQNLARRAYIVSRDSGDMTVIDLDRLEIIGRVNPVVPTGNLMVLNAGSPHMAELNKDLTKIYVTYTDFNEIVVFDAKTLNVTARLPMGRDPTHLTLSRDGQLLAVMNEVENAITFVDPRRDVIIKRLPGFYTPHFMRYAPDGRYGYVANLGANHLTRVDLQTLEIDGHIALNGFQGPPNATEAPDEGGFADAQIATNGVLYAAHHATGRVLVYNTMAKQVNPEISVGRGPWVVYAEHPFSTIPLRHIVPNFEDQTISLLNAEEPTSIRTMPGDTESYGVNYSSLVPNSAFVMNRARKDISVVDTARGEITARIPVGGNTETASTTPDGKWIVAAVSGADRVVVIDAVTRGIVKTFDNVGRYPWSVLIPGGQNYCH